MRVLFNEQLKCCSYVFITVMNSFNTGGTSKLQYLSQLVLWHWPHVGSGVVRIDPLHFLAGCRTRRLNQASFILHLSML